MVDVLLSLRLRATGPELGSRRLGVPDEAVRPNLLSARLPDESFRVKPFCLGSEEEYTAAVEAEDGMIGSGRFRVSTVDREFKYCGRKYGEPWYEEQLGLPVIDDAL